MSKRKKASTKGSNNECFIENVPKMNVLSNCLKMNLWNVSKDVLKMNLWNVSKNIVLITNVL